MRVAIGDCRLFVDVEGPGLVPDGATMRERPTLLALHGGPGSDHTGFKPRFGEALGDLAQIVYVDQRGQGRSDRCTPDQWTFDRWADDVVELCDVLGIVAPVVLGVSFGGMVALHYAVRHPGHAGGLVLDSTCAVPDLDAVLAQFERLGGSEAAEIAAAFWHDPDEARTAAYVRTCLPLYARHPAADGDLMTARSWETANVELFQHWTTGEQKTFDLRGRLGAITCPVLVLAGEDDPVTPPAGARLVADEIGPDRCRLEVVADCGHGVCRDRGETAFPLVRDFLAGHHAVPAR